MSYYKWRLLFDKYKEFFNIEHGKKYILHDDKDVLAEGNSWF